MAENGQPPKEIPQELDILRSDLDRLSWLLIRLSNRVNDLEMLIVHHARLNQDFAQRIAGSMYQMNLEKASRTKELLKFQVARLEQVNAPDVIVEGKRSSLTSVAEMEEVVKSQNALDRFGRWSDERLDYQGELLLDVSTNFALFPDPDGWQPTIAEILPSGLYEAVLAEKLSGGSSDSTEEVRG